MYDVTDASSFSKIKDEIYEFTKKHMQSECSFHVLVGNKSDVVDDQPERREISYEEASDFS